MTNEQILEQAKEEFEAKRLAAYKEEIAQHLAHIALNSSEIQNRKNYIKASEKTIREMDYATFVYPNIYSKLK